MTVPFIKVEGSAAVPGQPDEVEVDLEVTFVGPTGEEALSEVVRRSDKLEDLFEELSITRTAWSTSGVSVREEGEWTKERYVHKGYRATNRLRLRLSGAEPLGRLIPEATARARARVHGPRWRIALANPARAHAVKRRQMHGARRAPTRTRWGPGWVRCWRLRSRGSASPVTPATTQPTSNPPKTVS